MGFKETIDSDQKGLKLWKTYHNYMKNLGSASVLSAGLLVLFLLSTVQVSAQPLVKDTPTGTSTEGDISINPEEPLPDNGTVSISTEGATDTNMNGFPPEGVTVIISSDTATVTNQPVDIATDEGGDAGDEGDEGDTGGGNEEGDENEGDENEGEGGIVGGNQ